MYNTLSDPVQLELVNAHHHMLEMQDEKISQHNLLMKAAHDKLLVAQDRAMHSSLESAQLNLNRVKAKYRKQIEIGKALAQTGSGNIPLLLPSLSSEPIE